MEDTSTVESTTSSTSTGTQLRQRHGVETTSSSKREQLMDLSKSITTDGIKSPSTEVTSPSSSEIEEKGESPTKASLISKKSNVKGDHFGEGGKNSDSNTSGKERAMISRKGSIPIHLLDDEMAKEEIEYRVSSSTTIVEVSAVLGGFAFDRFMSTYDYIEIWENKHGYLFWILAISTFIAFCANMITVAAMSMEIYVVNRLLSKNPIKAAKFARDLSGVRRMAVMCSFGSVPCLLIAVLAYSFMAFEDNCRVFIVLGTVFLALFGWVVARMQKLALRQDYSIVGGWYLRLTGQRKDKYL